MELAKHVYGLSQDFMAIDEKEFENFFINYNFQVKYFKKGEIIIYAGSEYHHSIFLLSGLVHTSVIGDNGNEVGINYFKPGEILGALIPFSSQGRISVNIVCDIDVSVIWFSKDFLVNLSVSHPVFLRSLFQSTADKIIGLSLKVNDMKFKKLKERLFETLVKLSNGRREFQLPYSKTRLAEVIGGSRPAVSRCITTLVKENKVRVEGRGILLLD